MLLSLITGGIPSVLSGAPMSFLGEGEERIEGFGTDRYSALAKSSPSKKMP